jgi:L-lactate dehydrogenase complex protein LldF
MGAVLTPLLNSAREAGELREASSLCAACWQACPVQIPLQDMLLALRRDHAADAGRAQSLVWDAWAATWSNPALYRASTRAAASASRVIPLRMTPARWSQDRDVPRAPHGPAFRSSRGRTGS